MTPQETPYYLKSEEGISINTQLEHEEDIFERFFEDQEQDLQNEEAKYGDNQVRDSITRNFKELPSLDQIFGQNPSSLEVNVTSQNETLQDSYKEYYKSKENKNRANMNKTDVPVSQNFQTFSTQFIGRQTNIYQQNQKFQMQQHLSRQSQGQCETKQSMKQQIHNIQQLTKNQNQNIEILCNKEKDIQVNPRVQKKKVKSEKNFIKNFSLAIYKYLKNQKEYKISSLLKILGIDRTKFFKRYRKSCFDIKNQQQFYSLFSDRSIRSNQCQLSQYRKALRIIAFKFIREEMISYVYCSSRIATPSEFIKLKAKAIILLTKC